MSRPTDDEIKRYLEGVGTVLEEKLKMIRMRLAATGGFDDRPSVAVGGWIRDLTMSLDEAEELGGGGAREPARTLIISESSWWAGRYYEKSRLCRKEYARQGGVR